MSIRSPAPSLLRPKRPLSQDILMENRRLVERIDRRNVLRGALSLGALAFLTGCDVTENDRVQTVLRAVSSWNDRVQAWLFRPNHLAPTFTEAEVVKPPRFNAYYGIEQVKPVDAASWRLEVAGRIENKRPWTLQEILRPPRAGTDYPSHLCRGMGLYRPMVRGEFTLVPRADRCRSFGEVHCISLRRRLFRKHRHAVSSASADHTRHEVCSRADHRSVRLPAAFANLDETRLQKPEMDRLDGGYQRFPGHVLSQARL